jgi:hypothetical protein
MWPRFWHPTSHPHLPQGQRPKTIPIVFVTWADPVKVGLVESLSRPTGNLTGVSVFSLFSDQNMWNCCMSFFHQLTRSHCSEILKMPTSSLKCLTFGPRPKLSSNA